MQRPHPMTSIRWQLPLSYALIALVAALSLSAVLINLLRQHYGQQELALLSRTAATIDNILAPRLAQPFTAETVPLELSDLSAFLDVRIETLSLDNAVLSDTGIPQSFTVTMGILGNPAGSMVRAPVETYARPSLVITGGEFIQMPTALPPENMTYAMPSGTTITDGAIQDVMLTTAPTTHDNIIQFAPQPESDSMPFFNRREMWGGSTRFSQPAFLDASTTEVSVEGGRVMLISSRERSDQQVVIGVINPMSGEPLGYLRVSGLPAIGTEIVNSVAQGALIAGTSAIVLAAATGYIISRRLTAPLSQLETAAHDMAAGEYWVRADIKRSDELGKLADAFNGMAQQVESTVTALRRFVADAAHELHTPLTALRADLELTREQPAQEKVSNAIKQAIRLEALCDDLLDLSRLESPTLFWQTEATPVDMGGLIQELGEVYASRAEQSDIGFELEVAPVLPTLPTGNPSQIRRALGNLLDNALKFTPAGGTVTLAATPSEAGFDIHITDSGIGIPPSEKARVFDHFYRGSNTHDYPGSGLGLAITNAIVKAHGGRIEVESGGGGTHFHVLLPMAQITKP